MYSKIFELGSQLPDAPLTRKSGGSITPASYLPSTPLWELDMVSVRPRSTARSRYS
jgi:hypothetical protein